MATSRYGTQWYEDPIYAAEEEIEKRMGDWTGKGRLPIIRIAALISLAIGIRGYMEVSLACIALAISYFTGTTAPDGIDGAIQALSGVQVARGQFKTVAFPVLVELLETLHAFQKGVIMSQKSAIGLGIFAVSYGLTLFKVIK